MDTSQPIVDLLNALLAAELGAGTRHVLSGTAMASARSIAARSVVEAVASAQAEHSAWLTEAIFDAGGNPGLAQPSTHWGGINYRDLCEALPDLADQSRALAQRYAASLAQLGDQPAVQQLLERIRARHQQHIDQLNAAR